MVINFFFIYYFNCDQSKRMLAVIVVIVCLIDVSQSPLKNNDSQSSGTREHRAHIVTHVGNLGAI